MSSPRRDRPPLWTTLLLLVVAAALAFLAAGMAVSASEQSGLPVARLPVTAVEDGSCGRSGPCSRPVISPPGVSGPVVAEGFHWDRTEAPGLVGQPVEVRYDARAGRAWATRELPLTAAVGGVCGILAAVSAAAGVLSRTHPERLRP